MYEYIALEMVALFLASILLVSLLRRFTKDKSLLGIVTFPLGMFVVGFSLRLSGVAEAIDIGFFFTDFSFLFVYIVFALSFLLGQVKYWRINSLKKK